MKITARVDNSYGKHEVTVRTNERERALVIAPRDDGLGSSANGGELLCLALATCYCNDLYREARKRGIAIERVEVEVEAAFGAEGAPAESISYRARVQGGASPDEVVELMRHTDTVVEIQNTVRKGVTVLLNGVDAG